MKISHRSASWPLHAISAIAVASLVALAAVIVEPTPDSTPGPRDIMSKPPRLLVSRPHERVQRLILPDSPLDLEVFELTFD